MNVLLVASKYPPEHSGAGKRLHQLYKRMNRKHGGIHWHVLTTKALESGTGIYDGIFVFRIPGARDAKSSNYGVRYKILEMIYGLRELTLSFIYLRKLKKGGVDIVHTCGWSWCVIAACFWARWNKIPIIRELTSMTDHPFSRSWMRWVIQITLKWSKHIVAISPFLGEQCSKAGFSKKTWCRPNPIDENIFKLVSIEEKKVMRKNLFPHDNLSKYICLLNFGRIRPSKNQLILLHMLKQLPEFYKLIIAGPIDVQNKIYLDKINQEIVKLRIEKRVIMKVGNHDHPERFMQAADLFLFPSISEGLGTVVLEALMCGLPVVATPLQGITDQIIQNGRNGFLADFKAKDLCEFIEKGIALGDKREEISKMAHAIFNATLIDEKYYKLLQFSKDSVIKNQISAIN